MADADSALFRHFAQLGYKSRLIPVMPPGCEISPHSRLQGLIDAGKDARGKMPGLRGGDGSWFGFRDWQHYATDDNDLERWASWGANVGMRAGNGFGDVSGGVNEYDWLCAFDADTLSASYARTIFDAVRRVIGVCPIRIGRSPKALYLFRLAGPVPFMKLKFGVVGEPREHVEVLGAGKQFVCGGRHPSGRDYEWHSPLVPFGELPVVPVGVLDGLLNGLREALPGASGVERSGGAAGEGKPPETSPAALRATGGVDEVAHVLAVIRNDGRRFESREAYLSIGYAVKAALADDPEAGFALWSKWCASWTGGENRDETIASDWARMKAPYRRGAGWLHEVAEEVSEGAYRAAVRWFEPIVEDGGSKEGGSKEGGLFPELAEDIEARRAARERNATVATIRATPFDSAAAFAVTPRAFLLGSHWIRKYLSVTVAPSKVGKTALLIGDALAAVTGRPVLGAAPVRPLRVWLWNGEDPLDEMQRRLAAAMRLHEITGDDIGDRLFLDSGRAMPVKIARMERSGAVIARPVVDAVISTVLENRIDVMVVDPFISSHQVSENDNPSIDAVAKTWAYIADATNCAIDLVHHMRKLNGEESTVEDMRGASALLAATRSSRALARMSKEEARNRGLEGRRRQLFHIADIDSNVAPVGDKDSVWFELASVRLPNGTPEYPDGDNVGAVRLFDMVEETAAIGDAPPDFEKQALASIESGDWRLHIRAGDAWVGCAIGQAFGIDRSTNDGRTRIAAIVSEWLSAGKIVEETRMDESRRPRQFVKVVKKDDCF